jgi:uncharacterized protein (UPF0332 family)
MPFDWKQYLSFADELSKRSEEAALRSAVSRAYYAAFCTARNHLRGKGEQIPDSEQTHKVVWESFQRRGKTYAAVYQNGVRLRSRRRQADYEDEIKDLSNLVTEALRDAKNVLHWLDKAIAQDSST